MPNVLLIASAEGGGFNPLDIASGGMYFWTLLIFGASIVPMWMLVFSKIAKAAVERDARASEAIVAAERANAEALKVRAEVEVKLGEAQAEAAKLLTAARERAEVRERDIIGNAKKEADAMIESARNTINAEKEKALTAIRQEVVELSLHAASKVIGRNVGAEDDRRLVEELVAGKAAAGGGPA